MSALFLLHKYTIVLVHYLVWRGWLLVLWWQREIQVLYLKCLTTNNNNLIHLLFIFRLHFGDSLNVFIVRALKRPLNGKMNVVPNLNIVAISKVSKYIESSSFICRDELFLLSMCSQKTTVEVAWPVVPEIISPWHDQRPDSLLLYLSTLALPCPWLWTSCLFLILLLPPILFYSVSVVPLFGNAAARTGPASCIVLFPSSSSTESSKSEQWSTFVTLSVFCRFSNNLLPNLIIIVVI